MSDITVTKLQDVLNDIERNAYEGILGSEEITRAYVLAGELGENIEKLKAENKNLIANYEMLSVSYMDSKRVCEHLFTELKRYKSLLRAKLPERELMLIDEILKLRSKARHMYVCIQHASYDEHTCESCPYDNENGACDFEKQLRELGIEVPK